MTQTFKGWEEVAKSLLQCKPDHQLNAGQVDSLHRLAQQLPHNGMVLADEVGMGKTRIAAALVRSVVAAGGRVAILVPPGLGYQWGSELNDFGVKAAPVLRSLWSFFGAWKEDIEANTKPWFNEDVVLLSHSMANWRLGAETHTWRVALLADLNTQWRRLQTGKELERFDQPSSAFDPWVRRASISIAKAFYTKDESNPLSTLMEDLPHNVFRDPSHYTSESSLRKKLERAVGWGLGPFDLVVIDEAHKSRHEKSGLSRLLDRVIVRSDQARTLGMTATPFELDSSQWTEMLTRIGVDGEAQNKIINVIKDYQTAVRNAQQRLSDPVTRDAFKRAALAFQTALSPYVMRRDKRQDADVQRFVQSTRLSHHEYRRECEIIVDTDDISSDWKQAVCAAEALSFVVRQSDKGNNKRLRLTFGNGHGIASLLDQSTMDEAQDEARHDGGTDTDAPLPQNDKQDDAVLTTDSNDKRLERAEWWNAVARLPFESEKGHHALLKHPSIQRTVAAIEEICTRGEKVLVFGKFTQPMRALVQLLNARQMLRSLAEGKAWPQERLHQSTEEIAALEVAWSELRKGEELNKEALSRSLSDQYTKKIKEVRRKVQTSFLEKLDLIQAALPGKPEGRLQALFKECRNKVATQKQPVPDSVDEEKHDLAIMTRALTELLDPESPLTPEVFANTFVELIEASSDRDAQNDKDPEDGDSNAEVNVAEEWAQIWDRISEEYGGQSGGFARLMNGTTKPQTRRFQQLAFNRKSSHLKVLVAQSLVGREGLNLHKACRTVVLLHPEWNPGVVEQQIGRVDRIGSLWAEKLREFEQSTNATPEESPRIEFCPVVFRGTYDEKNWEVLNERWRDLRAQLHGVVISPKNAKEYPGQDEWIAEVNNAAPRFSPVRDDPGAIGSAE